MKVVCFLAGLIFSGALCVAAPIPADVVFHGNEQTTGRVVGIETLFLQVDVVRKGKAARVEIPLIDVSWVDFGEKEILERALKEEPDPSARKLGPYWSEREPLLELPGSTAGEVGLKFAATLLDDGSMRSASLALEILQKLIAEDWNAARVERARELVLRALLTLGRKSEAAAAANEALEAGGPRARASAHLTLGEVVLEEGTTAQAGNEALNHFLLSYLVAAEEKDLAARGLWRAVQMMGEMGDQEGAKQRAEDLVRLFPETREAQNAREFLMTESAGE